MGLRESGVRPRIFPRRGHRRSRTRPVGGSGGPPPQSFFPKTFLHPDSPTPKNSPQKKRDYFSDLIFEEAVAVGVGIVGPDKIDRINILQASLLSMAIAVENLRLRPDYLLIDGKFTIASKIPQKAIVKGRFPQHFHIGGLRGGQGASGPNHGGIPSAISRLRVRPAQGIPDPKRTRAPSRNTAAAPSTEKHSEA